MIRLRQIKILVEEDSLEYLEKKIKKLLHVPILREISIIKKSLDARKKEQLFYVYEVDVSCESEEQIIKKRGSINLFLAPKEEYVLPTSGDERLKQRPVIVGSGPAGLFCGYMLAQCGYHPLIIERGDPVEERVLKIESFWEDGVLDLDSNVQFGEGGAGTFSDGKLNTLVKDKWHRGKKVFEILVENGAPKEILYINKPHIGTDLLREVIVTIRNKIISMGGEFRYRSLLTDIICQDGKVSGVVINEQEKIPCSVVVLAIGHSARDTFSWLYEKGIVMRNKPFAVGIRIQHSQQFINDCQYGSKYAKLLEPASYKLTYTTKQNRGVYSFCMCPGGYVVNASSEEGRLAINGMSNHARDTENANSALIVTVDSKDFGADPLAGMEFQRELEECAYSVGQGKIPVQLYQDFVDHKVSNDFLSVSPVFKGGYTFADLNQVLPKYVGDSVKEAISYFDQKMPGYASGDAILAGVESRTSSPIQIERDQEGQANIRGLYPCGEGSGYAGGITTAAMDGVKIAELIIQKYCFKID